MFSEWFDRITPPPLQLRFEGSALGGLVAMAVWLRMFPCALGFIPRPSTLPVVVAVMVAWTVVWVVVGRGAACLTDRILSRIADRW